MSLRPMFSAAIFTVPKVQGSRKAKQVDAITIAGPASASQAGVDL